MDSGPSTSPPSRANLKAWWRSFKTAQKAKRNLSSGLVDEKSSPPHAVVFGVPLRESLRYANVPISTASGSGGVLYIYGYVPVVVAKCGLYLKETATEVEGTFRVNGSAKRMRQLQQEFETPPKYGKTIDWKKSIYTPHDVASVFRRYLTQMPEPVIPYNLYYKFRDAYAQEPFNHDRVVKTFQSLIQSMPRANQYLLLYVLDLLSVFARKSKKNLMTTTNLAVIFRPGILSHPDQELSPIEHKLSQQVVEFLIDQQDRFLLEIPPPPRNDSILVPSQSARLAGATGAGSPLVPTDDEYFMVPSSGEEEGVGAGAGAEEGNSKRGGWKLVETKARANRNRPPPKSTTMTMTAAGLTPIGNSSDIVLAPDTGSGGGAGLSVKRSLTVPSRKSPRTAAEDHPSSSSGAGAGGGKKLQRRPPRGGRELSPVRAGAVSISAGSGGGGGGGVKRSGSVATRRTGGYTVDMSI